jgi:uncharacterized protein YbgA (DUF1722 family)/uncharacterized protein YbbK (DUF523 family)
MDKIRVGVSTCLLGERVRFDGGHKLDRFIRDMLGQFMEYVPVCPEVECGLSTPREAMRLVGDPEAPRLVTVRSGRDLTEHMEEWSRKRLRELEREDLDGFIFKSRSPSSGMERVRVYDTKGVPRKVGVGIFAREFMRHFPLVPVEEEGRLNDPRLRESFIERIFVMHRYRTRVAREPSARALVEFHTAHKLLILSHSQRHHRELGRLVAEAGRAPLDELLQSYQTLLMAALKLKATPAKHANVLHHMLGYFKKQLSSDEKQELLEIIERYRSGYVPLVVPITLLAHYVRKYRPSYLEDQVYLNPHPLELQLRNHA